MILLLVRSFDLTGRPAVGENAFDRAWFRVANEETNQTLDYSLINKIPIPEDYQEWAEPGEDGDGEEQ